MLAIAPKQTSVARDFTPHRGNSQSGKNGKGKYSLSKGIVPRVTRLVNSRGNGHLRYWKASAVSIMLTVLMTCEVFIPLNDIATEGYECGRPGEYDDRLEMVVCEEHKRELVEFNAVGSPKGVAASTRQQFSGAA